MSDLPFDPEKPGTLYCAVFAVAGGQAEKFITPNDMATIEAAIERGLMWVEFEDIAGSTFRARTESYMGTYISTEASRRATVYHGEAMLWEQERHEDAFRQEFGWRPRDD